MIIHIFFVLFFIFQDAHKFAQDCNPKIQPNRGFIEQLLSWERTLFGEKEGMNTDISDPNF